MKDEWRVMVAVGSAEVYTFYIDLRGHHHRELAADLEKVIKEGKILGATIKRRLSLSLGGSHCVRILVIPGSLDRASKLGDVFPMLSKYRVMGAYPG